MGSPLFIFMRFGADVHRKPILRGYDRKGRITMAKTYYNVIFTADLSTHEVEYIYYTLSDKAAADEYVGSEACELDFSEWLNCDLNAKFAEGGASIEEVTLADDAIEAACYEESDDRAVARRLGVAKEFATWLAKTFRQEDADGDSDYGAENWYQQALVNVADTNPEWHFQHFENDELPF